MGRGAGSAAEGLGIILIAFVGIVIYIITSILEAIGNCLVWLGNFIVNNWLILLSLALFLGIIAIIVVCNRKKNKYNRIRKRIESLPDGLEKDILLSYYHRHILINQKNVICKRIHKLETILAKRPNNELQLELNNKYQEVTSIESQISSFVIQADCNLNSYQLNEFENVKKYLVSISRCDKVWTNSGKPNFIIGRSDYLETTFDIPKIIIGAKELHIFPKIILEVNSNWNIVVKPIESVMLSYKDEDVLVVGAKPKDTTWDWYRWDYERVNGGPDRRYRNNNCYHYYRAGKNIIGSFIFFCSNSSVGEKWVNELKKYIKTLTQPLPQTQNPPKPNSHNNNHNQNQNTQQNNHPQNNTPNQNHNCDCEFEKSIETIFKDFSFEEICDNLVFVNILDDFNAFKNDKSYKFILKSMIEHHVLLNIYKKGKNQFEVRNIIRIFISNTGLDYLKCQSIIDCILKYCKNGQL